MDQIQLHKKIEMLLRAGSSNAKFEVIKNIISVNKDAYEYFFNRADEKWLEWLWKNDFLRAITRKAMDENQYSYTLPELQYLVNVSEKDPAGVVDIMLQVPISKDNFNPEVLSRFLWICGSLPTDQMARVVEKIRDEKWVELMKKFNHFGFEYDKMIEKLYEANDWKNILILTDAILSIRSEEDLSESERKYGTENPFYFNDLGQIKIFQYLIKVDNDNLENALGLISGKMGMVAKSHIRENRSKIFKIGDSFGFYDIDFFTLGLDDDKHLSYRDDVENMAATLKILVNRAMSNECSSPQNVKNLYEKYINSLPLSYVMWRFRLYVLSLYPEIFKSELEKEFFRFFENEGAYDLILGAEYSQALKKGFSVLSDARQREFIKKVIDFFSTRGDDKRDKDWHKYKGRQILSCISDYLKGFEIELAEKTFEGKLEKNYQPEPSIVHNGMAGFISPKAPATLEDLQKKTISEIVERLSTDWSPLNLRKIDRDDDFHHPLNASGMSNLLKEDIAHRMDAYLNNANLFFDRDKLDEHYTYSFLQGIFEVIRSNDYTGKSDLSQLLVLIENILKSDKENTLLIKKENDKGFDTWTANWSSVFYSISDVIRELLGDNKDSALIDFSKYRNRLLEVITYLLNNPNPSIKDNEIEEGNDPFSTAINSVRGRAFQSLVLFIYRDGEKFAKDDKIKINEDVKTLYVDVLKKERTYAVMFLYGHYLPTFFYRDKEWIRDLIPEIFTEETARRDLYMAAWEGYVAANIYGDMFKEFGGLYERAIKNNPANYTKRKYFRDLDEGLATHLALAYAHFPDFNIDSDLFKIFWNIKNTKRQKEFVSYVGRYVVSRDSALTYIEKNKIDLNKIKKLWDWVLTNVEDPEIFSGFGFWVDKEQNVFNDPKWLADHIWKTLIKSGGDTNWDFGLIKSLPILAKSVPEETLKILRVYLLDQYNNKPSFRTSVYVDDFLTAFKTIYENNETKNGAYDLINALIVKGGSRFWKLKEILD